MVTIILATTSKRDLPPLDGWIDVFAIVCVFTWYCFTWPILIIRVTYEFVKVIRGESE